LEHNLLPAACPVDGARHPHSKEIEDDLSARYVFDRYYFTGRTVSDQHHDRIDVGAGPSVSLQFQARW
jgi:hypothetical protein